MCAYVNSSRDLASAQGKHKGGDKKKNRAEGKQERRDYRKVDEVVEERKRTLLVLGWRNGAFVKLFEIKV
jgi:hypothetical protein